MEKTLIKKVRYKKPSDTLINEIGLGYLHEHELEFVAYSIKQSIEVSLRCILEFEGADFDKSLGIKELLCLIPIRVEIGYPSLTEDFLAVIRDIEHWDRWSKKNSWRTPSEELLYDGACMALAFAELMEELYWSPKRHIPDATKRKKAYRLT